MKQKLDQRIIDFLAKKGIDTPEKLEEFLNPTTAKMLNPFDLDGMEAAVSRIKKAIALKEKIVIYGDYDCDGISACIVLYRFLLFYDYSYINESIINMACYICNNIINVYCHNYMSWERVKRID